MKKYKLSKWTHFFKKDSDLAIFHSKNLEIFFIDELTMEFLKLFKDQELSVEEVLDFKLVIDNNEIREKMDTLINFGFLVDSEIDEFELLSKDNEKEIEDRKHSLGEKTHLNALRIVLTEKCNLFCDYCFVKSKKDISKSKDITFDIIKKGVHLLCELNKGEIIEIQFFGGEPLVKFDLIKETVNYVDGLIKDGKIKDVGYGITTNGVLVKDEHSTFFKKNNFLVSVSLDGWEDLHNTNRKDVNGKGSFNDTIKGLKNLKKHDNDTGILVTPSPNNIDDLAKACEYIIEELDFKYLTINTPQPINGNWDVSGKKFSQELKKCFEIAEKNNAIINSFATRTLFSLNDKQPMILACSKFGNNYTATLTSDGRLGPCIVSWEHAETLVPIEEFEYGNKFADWKLMEPHFLEKCKSCPAMNVCGGPCPLEIYELEKHSKIIDHERCNFFKDFLEWSIWYKN